MLRKNFFSSEELIGIIKDFRHAGLPPAEVAMMEYAEKITLNAGAVTEEDIDGLRAHGFKDEEILDIALVAAARNFYSKALDALGAQPDEAMRELDFELQEALAARGIT